MGAIVAIAAITGEEAPDLLAPRMVGIADAVPAANFVSAPS